MIFFVTVPDIKLGEELAFALVKAKIAACVNIVKGITSIYTWKEKIEKNVEKDLRQMNCFDLLALTEISGEYQITDLISFIPKSFIYKDIPIYVMISNDQFCNYVV